MSVRRGLVAERAEHPCRVQNGRVLLFRRLSWEVELHFPLHLTTGSNWKQLVQLRVGRVKKVDEKMGRGEERAILRV